jgi:hypothetical protein
VDQLLDLVDQGRTADMEFFRLGIRLRFGHCHSPHGTDPRVGFRDSLKSTARVLSDMWKGQVTGSRGYVKRINIGPETGRQ